MDSSIPLHHPRPTRCWDERFEDRAQEQEDYNQVSQNIEVISLRVSPVPQPAGFHANSFTFTHPPSNPQALCLPPVQSQSQWDALTDALTQSYPLSSALGPNQEFMDASTHHHSYTNTFTHPYTDTFTHPYTDTFTHPYTEAFTHPYTDAFTHPYTDVFTHPYTDVSSHQYTDVVQGNLSSENFASLSQEPSLQPFVEEGQANMEPWTYTSLSRLQPSIHEVKQRALLMLQHLNNPVEGEMVNDISHPPSLQPVQHLDQNQGRLTLSTTSLVWDDRTERATRTRAINKEDRGAKSHSWGVLLKLDKPTHDALRWAEEYSDIGLAGDRFPSRRPSDVDLVVEGGVNLYASEHGVRPGKSSILYTSSFPHAMPFIELKISAPDSRRKILNVINVNRSNDQKALDTQIVCRFLGFLKLEQALKPNLLRMSEWFGSDFDFIDFTSSVRIRQPLTEQC
jgi:hypothetical protein